jgi:hypothetical protein
MGRPCSLCAHVLRPQAEEELLRGASVRTVAALTGVSKSAVAGHRNRCMTQAIQKASEPRMIERSDKLMRRLDALLAKALEVATRAEKRKNDGLLLKALNDARSTLRVMGEFIGARAEPPRVQNSYTIVFEGGRPVAKELPAGEVVEVHAEQS